MQTGRMVLCGANLAADALCEQGASAEDVVGLLCFAVNLKAYVAVPMGVGSEERGCAWGFRLSANRRSWDGGADGGAATAGAAAAATRTTTTTTTTTTTNGPSLGKSRMTGGGMEAHKI